MCWLWLLALAAGCNQVERAALLVATGPSEVVEIPVNAQGEAGNLRIGLGYVRKSSPVDVSGTPRSLEAGLWIYVREDSSKDLKISVRAGQRISVGTATIFVEEIRGGRRAAVRLTIYGLTNQLSSGSTKP